MTQLQKYNWFKNILIALVVPGIYGIFWILITIINVSDTLVSIKSDQKDMKTDFKEFKDEVRAEFKNVKSNIDTIKQHQRDNDLLQHYNSRYSLK